MTKVSIEPACRKMEWLDPFYKQVWEKAFAEAIPISGTFELTPRCNFNCRMCYVHLSESQIPRYGIELSTEEWIRLAQEVKEAGTIWLCVTGGEPLMHSGFEVIWRELTEMGFFITLQTNASLITKYERLFEEHPPRACKITIYGSNDEIYKAVCRVENGFTRTNQGIQMLKQMGIPIELVSTVIRQNYADVERIIDYANRQKLNWIPNMNIRPSYRGADVNLSDMKVYPRKSSVKKGRIQSGNEINGHKPPLAYCKDYRLGYWIVWNGYLRFCSFLNGPDINVREQSFRRCWKKLIEFEDTLEWPEECGACLIRDNCQKCAASCEMRQGALHIVEEFCKLQKSREAN